MHAKGLPPQRVLRAGGTSASRARVARHRAGRGRAPRPDLAARDRGPGSCRTTAARRSSCGREAPDVYWGSYSFAGATLVRDPREGLWSAPVRVCFASEAQRLAPAHRRAASKRARSAGPWTASGAGSHAHGRRTNATAELSTSRRATTWDLHAWLRAGGWRPDARLIGKPHQRTRAGAPPEPRTRPAAIGSILTPRRPPGAKVSRGPCAAVRRASSRSTNTSTIVGPTARRNLRGSRDTAAVIERRAIRTIRRHRVERIRHRHDARVQRNRFAREVPAGSRRRPSARDARARSARPRGAKRIAEMIRRRCRDACAPGELVRRQRAVLCGARRRRSRSCRCREDAAVPRMPRLLGAASERQRHGAAVFRETPQMAVRGRRAPRPYARA